MKFMVTRTSTYGDEQPCPEASREPFVSIDVRTFKTPEKYQERCGDDWFAAGRNHRKYGPGIARDFDAEGWFIEVESLEDLIAFQDEHGSIVLTYHHRNPDIREIEIYDGYRE